jgi:protoporphyrinogen oxidase
VLESRHDTGGLASAWRCDEFSADLGPHRIFTELPEIEALLPELIAAGDTITVKRRSELLLGGHFYTYPVRALELLREMGFGRMALLGASAAAGKLAAVAAKPANYAEAMKQAFGAGVYNLIIGPYTRKVWKIDPQELSEEVARVRVSAGNTNRLVKRLLGGREQKGAQTALDRFTYIRGGAQMLVRSLEDHVRSNGGTIETGREVRSFRRDGERIVAVATTSGPQGGDVETTADHVISTIPVTDLVNVLQGHVEDRQAAHAARELVFVGMILVGAIIRRTQFTPNTWLYFPEDRFVFNRAYEPRNFDPGMAPADRTMAVFEVTARWDSQLWKTSEDDLIALVRHDLIETGLLRASEIENIFTLRIPHAYPLYTVRFRDHLDRVCDYLRRFPNLVSTGRQGLFNHNNMDHSMLMGIRAAECVAANPDPAPAWYDSLGQFSHFRIVD